jgi:hypothetical protein
VSLLSLVLVGYAANEFDCTLAGYLADSYTVFAALALLRALCCAMFPLFAHQMFTDLAKCRFIHPCRGCHGILPQPIIFFRYGRRIRQSSKFAKYSLQAYNENQVDHNDWEDDGTGALSLPAIWYRWHKSKSTDLPETVAWSLSLNESFASRNVILEV